MGLKGNLRTPKSLFWIQARFKFGLNLCGSQFITVTGPTNFITSPRFLSLSLKTFPDTSRPRSRPPAKPPNHSPIPRSPSSRSRSALLKNSIPDLRTWHYCLDQQTPPQVHPLPGYYFKILRMINGLQDH